MVHTSPDVARKHDRVTRSWKEAHGHFAEFEKPTKTDGVVYLLWFLYGIVIVGWLAWCIFDAVGANRV